MANIYFIMWTQVGSFLVLLAIMYIYLVYNTVYIQQITNSLPLAISLFIFFGFGVKIPV
jgi:formate hydrogenlyase subunit 3/multisubunit Na+/H+ antiporter MnhD subunit